MFGDGMHEETYKEALQAMLKSWQSPWMRSSFRTGPALLCMPWFLCSIACLSAADMLTHCMSCMPCKPASRTCSTVQQCTSAALTPMQVIRVHVIKPSATVSAAPSLLVWALPFELPVHIFCFNYTCPRCSSNSTSML